MVPNTAHAKLGSKIAHSEFMAVLAAVAPANIRNFRGFRQRLKEDYNCGSESAGMKD